MSYLFFLISGTKKNNDLINCFEASGYDVIFADDLGNEALNELHSCNLPFSLSRGPLCFLVCFNPNLLSSTYKSEIVYKRLLSKLARRINKCCKPKPRLFLLQFSEPSDIPIALLRKDVELDKLLEDKKKQYQFDGQLIFSLGQYSRKSVLYLVEKDGVSHVHKIFRDGYELYWQREVEVRANLNFPWIGHLIDATQLHLIMPYYATEKSFKAGLFGYFPVSKAQRIMSAMAELNAAGYALVDWHPGNFLLGPDDTLKVVDFEFCQRVEPCLDFQQSVDYIGGGRYKLDHPGRSFCGYHDFWFPVLGIDYQTLMHGTKFRIVLHRFLHWFRHRLPSWLKMNGQNFLNFMKYLYYRPRLRGSWWCL